MTEPVPRLLTIMGSGETAPTMVKVHRMMLERLGPPPVPAVLLDTPFGFQENAVELAQRVSTYFRDSLRATIEVASAVEDAGGAAGTRASGSPGVAGAKGSGGGGTASGGGTAGSGGALNDDPFARERLVSSVRNARYVFAGPGSPTYALRRWSGTVVPSLLKEKLRHGGGITFSSAAALTLGTSTVPVYEVYKVGEDPHWLTGLDLLGEAGIRAAVIPHYNNAEGGTHDTRFCYLGERRLSMIEPALPDGAFVLGIDEHTAITFDLDSGSATIAGLGVVTVRAAGRSKTFSAGSELTVAQINETAEALVRSGGRAAGDAAEDRRAGGGDGLVAGDGSAAGADGRSAGNGDAAGSASSGAGSVGSGGSGAGLDGEPASAIDGAGSYRDSPLIAVVHEQEDAFSSALQDRDVKGAVAALLELEGQVTEWANDIPAGDAMDRARASLRSLVVELGRVAETGARDPRDMIGPFVETMLELRAKARADRRFGDSDIIRNRLEALGIEVRDTPQGAEWLLASP